MNYLEACENYRKAVQELQEAAKSVEQAKGTLSVMEERKERAKIRMVNAARDLRQAAGVTEEVAEAVASVTGGADAL